MNLNPLKAISKWVKRRRLTAYLIAAGMAVVVGGLMMRNKIPVAVKPVAQVEQVQRNLMLARQAEKTHQRLLLVQAKLESGVRKNVREARAGLEGVANHLPGRDAELIAIRVNTNKGQAELDEGVEGQTPFDRATTILEEYRLQLNKVQPMVTEGKYLEAIALLEGIRTQVKGTPAEAMIASSIRGITARMEGARKEQDEIISQEVGEATVYSPKGAKAYFFDRANKYGEKWALRIAKQIIIGDKKNLWVGIDMPDDAVQLMSSAEVQKHRAAFKSIPTQIRLRDKDKHIQGLVKELLRRARQMN